MGDCVLFVVGELGKSQIAGVCDEAVLVRALPLPRRNALRDENRIISESLAAGFLQGDMALESAVKEYRLAVENERD